MSDGLLSSATRDWQRALDADIAIFCLNADARPSVRARQSNLSFHIGVDDRQRRHVDDPPHRSARRQNMYRLGRAQKYRPNGDISASSGLEQVVGNVRGIEIGEHQEVGITCQRAVRHHGAAPGAVECDIAMHFAVDL